MSSLFGEQQSRRFPSTSDRLWTESWWIFRTRARALAQPANCYRAALTNLCRCINRSQAALTRPPCFSPQQKKKKKKEEGQINKRGEKSCVFPPQTKRPPSERGGRLHIRLTDLFYFVWHFLFMRLFIFSSRLSPSEEIQQHTSSNTIVIPKTLGEHHHHARATITGETDINRPHWSADPQETAAVAPLHVGFLPPLMQNIHRGCLFIVSAIELHWCSTIVPSGEN